MNSTDSSGLDPYRDPIIVVALTFSPPTSNNTPKFDHYNYYMQILKIIKPSTCRFVMYPEIDKSGRLHYHGILHVKDEIRLYKDTFPKLRKMGFIKVKQMKTFMSILGWLTYCMKEWPKTKLVLECDEPIYRKRVHNKIQVKPDKSRPQRSLLEFGFFSADKH